MEHILHSFKALKKLREIHSLNLVSISHKFIVTKNVLKKKSRAYFKINEEKNSSLFNAFDQSYTFNAIFVRSFYTKKSKKKQEKERN